MAKTCPLCGARVRAGACSNNLCRGYKKPVASRHPPLPERKPPPPPNRPPEPARELTEREILVRIVRYQRWVMIALLANIPANVMGFLAPTQPLPIAIPMLVVSAAIAIYVIVAVFLLARYVSNAAAGVLCALLMCVPCVSLIVLLVVNQTAIGRLQRHGVEVGFFGADPASIE